MASFHPAAPQSGCRDAASAGRRRFIKPNGHLYLKPNGHLFLKPNGHLYLKPKPYERKTEPAFRDANPELMEAIDDFLRLKREFATLAAEMKCARLVRER
jgi:hypothetical protein